MRWSSKRQLWGLTVAARHSGVGGASSGPVIFDALPFAGAGRQMADGDGDAELVGEGLQLALPQPNPHAVATAAIGGDQQPRRFGIACVSHGPPPAANGIHRNARRVVVDADAHPADNDERPKRGIAQRHCLFDHRGKYRREITR